MRFLLHYTQRSFCWCSNRIRFDISFRIKWSDPNFFFCTSIIRFSSDGVTVKNVRVSTFLLFSVVSHFILFVGTTVIQFMCTCVYSKSWVVQHTIVLPASLENSGENWEEREKKNEWERWFMWYVSHSNVRLVCTVWMNDRGIGHYF